jgi:hypothetical protein
VRLFLFIVASIAPFFSAAIADQAHQRDVLPGGRPAYLGGAYTALSNDPYGAYYNPAGMAFSGKKVTEVSVTGSAFMTEEITYEGAVIGQDFNEKANSRYPSFIGTTYKLGLLTLAYAYLSGESRKINQNDSFDDISSVDGEASRFIRVKQETNELTLGGAALAIALGSSLSVGISGLYYDRSIESMVHQYTLFNGGSIQKLDTKYSTQNVGVLMIAGGIYRVDNFSFGATFRTTKPLNDRTKIHYEYILIDKVNPDEGKEELIDSKNDANKEVIPDTVALGAAFSPNASFCLSMDVLLHRGVDFTGVRQDLKNTANYSIGIEVVLGMLGLRAGAFTNNSLIAKPDPMKTSQGTYIDFVGFSGSIGLIGKTFETSFGAQIQEERDGQAQIVTGIADIQNVRAKRQILLVDGKFNL